MIGACKSSSYFESTLSGSLPMYILLYSGFVFIQLLHCHDYEISSLVLPIIFVSKNIEHRAT